MLEPEKSALAPEAPWTSAGHGSRIVKPREQQIFPSKGKAVDFSFYLQSSLAKLTVTSSNGKEAAIALRKPWAYKTLLQAFHRGRLPGGNPASPEIFSPAH